MDTPTNKGCVQWRTIRSKIGLRILLGLKISRSEFENMRNLVCYCLLGMAVYVSGCTSSRSQDPANEQFGNHSDQNRWEAVPVSLIVQQDLTTLTTAAAKKALRYPRSARILELPKFTAHYDKARGVTDVSVFGNGISVSPYSGEVTQGYWAEWEMTGKLAPDSHIQPTDWMLVGAVQTFDNKF